MTRAKPAPDEQPVLDDIAEHGWSGILIEEDEEGPGFEYTVGFMETLGHPEVIIFGLPKQEGHDILWQIFKSIQAGTPFAAPGRYEHVLVGRLCDSRFIHPSQYSEYLGYAKWHRSYVGKRGDLVAVQCVWPDADNHFPGELGCFPGVELLQPDLSCVRDDSNSPRASERPP